MPEQEFGFDRLKVNTWSAYQSQNESENDAIDSQKSAGRAALGALANLDNQDQTLDQQASELAVASLKTMLEQGSFGAALYSSSELALVELANTACYEATQLTNVAGTTNKKSDFSSPIQARFVDCQKLLGFVQARSEYSAANELDALARSIQESLQQVNFLCLHRIDCFCGNTQLEEFLFHLYNRRRATFGQQLLITSLTKPSDIEFGIRDLGSRVQALPAFRLPHPRAYDTSALIKSLASNRGMVLAPKIADYIASRISRNVDELDKALEKIDIFQRKEKKSLSIPLVKRALDMGA